MTTYTKWEPFALKNIFTMKDKTNIVAIYPFATKNFFYKVNGYVVLCKYS